MNIPNDSGHPWRLEKFVEYQRFAPAVDPLTYTEYAKRHNLDPDECVYFAWLHSVCYCEVTATLLFERLNFRTVSPMEVKRFWRENKDKLIFQSARRYVKNMDWFVPLMMKFLSAIRDNPIGEPYPFTWLVDLTEGQYYARDRYKAIEEHLKEWKYMGRFSIDLFLEAIITFNKAGLLPIKLENAGYDWNTTSNLTSGLLNIFYLDDMADAFDRGSLKITPDLQAFLDEKLQVVLHAAREKYPYDKLLDDVSIVNKICSFRNLFKGARYGGFHHDRQLGNILHYRKVYPEYKELWDEWFEIRATVFPAYMLGEYGGWTGIRKERKKLWIQKGLTGVEIP